MSKASTLFVEELDALGTFQDEPRTLRVEAGALALTCQVLSAESLGCAFSQLELAVPAGRLNQPAATQQWAQRLAQRITYLLEPLQVIEADGGGGVLVRSGPPERKNAATSYYELQVDPSGRLTLRRLRYSRQTGQRTAIPCQVTKEVLVKLIDDLEASQP